MENNIMIEIFMVKEEVITAELSCVSIGDKWVKIFDRNAFSNKEPTQNALKNGAIWIPVEVILVMSDNRFTPQAEPDLEPEPCNEIRV